MKINNLLISFIGWLETNLVNWMIENLDISNFIITELSSVVLCFVSQVFARQHCLGAAMTGRLLLLH